MFTRVRIEGWAFDAEALALARALGYRVPPAHWAPEGLSIARRVGAMIAHGNVNLSDAHKTPQFWLVWLVLMLNVSAGIGVIGAAAPMLQETFGGYLFGHPSVGFAQFTDEDRKLAGAVAAGFVGLFSLFNIAGRFFWASLSDKIGRKPIILAGCLIAALTFFPIFRMITSNANPALEKAIAAVEAGGVAVVDVRVEPGYTANMTASMTRTKN